MRRFLLDRLPPGTPGPETVVRQVFWRLGDGWTLRLRREGPPDAAPRDTVALRGPGSAGWEWALPADPAAVAALFRAGAGHRTIAVRRGYAGWAVDEYHWENEGLIVAAGTGAPPAWVGREITADGTYEDENLAFAPKPRP